ncbi:hypothetical protein [Caldicellulosiruptor bescii]|uniref:hypothetical protein n=1 Tax=Caldicellulosiruptor bescii TaxID=31899 RepID=UPI00211B4C2F|nr:hypothetical protein [Caldicellulosiruptor bescii]
MHDEKTIKTKDGRINIYALEKLALVVERVQKGQRLALGLDEKNSNQPQIEDSIRELIKALHEPDEPSVLN